MANSMINVALPKGRLGEKVYGMFAAAGYECPSILQPNRKLIFENAATREAILHCAGEKNLHGIRCICREKGIAEGAEEPLIQLLSLYGTPKSVMPTIRALAEENGVGEAAAELGRAVAGFAGTPMENKIRVDFSATGDTKYYNGIAFKGFISGIPGSVLSGGQYDHLMRRMGRRDKAVGFAVFLNMLERLNEEAGTNA